VKPRGFLQVDTTTYGPNGRGVVYRVEAEDGTIYVVQRHRWVLPSRRWAWKAVPQGLFAVGAAQERLTRYFDTLEEAEIDLFPTRFYVDMDKAAR